jgi:hypothetical protein
VMLENGGPGLEHVPEVAHPLLVELAPGHRAPLFIAPEPPLRLARNGQG